MCSPGRRSSNLIELADTPKSIVPEDIGLFKKLGLKPYFKIPTLTPHTVGTIQIGLNCVEITVIPGCTTSWKIRISDPKNHELTTIRTGSGSLKTYWESIKLFAEGMLCVETQKINGKALQTE